MASRFSGLVFVVALLAGCNDEGEKHLKAARTQYEALVVAGREPVDKGFDQVLRELDQVPADSRERAQAQALKDRITHARAPRVERPLVTPYAVFAEEPEVAAKKAECEQMAKALGEAPADKRELLRQRLVVCQTQQHEIEELRHSRAHAD
jgi:hypothetical protein